MAVVIGDPATFFASYYITGMAAGDPLILLKLAVISSIIALPFALIGRYLYGRMSGTAAVKTVAATVAAVTLYWVAAGAWRAVNGLAFFHEGFATSVIVSWVAALPLALLGVKLHEKMTSEWRLPAVLSAYASCFAASLVFWLFVWLVIQTTAV